MPESNWLAIPRPVTWADMRLICLPYAGGTTSTYLPWQDALPAQVELLAVQPPGRGDRLMEPGYASVETLVEALYPVISPYLDLPYALFGHSMGALIGHGLMRRIQAEGGTLPLQCIVSASPAPNWPGDEDVAGYSDEELTRYLRRLDGTPRAVLESEELMEIFLPRLRTDFTLAADYFSEPAPVLDTILHLLGGSDDAEIPEQALLGWQAFCRFGGKLDVIDGGHMFIETQRQAVLAVVNKVLNESLALLACDGFGSRSTV